MPKNQNQLSHSENRGVFTQVTAQFNRGSLIGLIRCLKVNVNDAGILIEYN